MDSKSRLLYWLLEASRGGPTRLRIIREINLKPKNIHQLSISLGLDYKTVQEHIEILSENSIVYSLSRGYGAVYFIDLEYEDNEYFKQNVIGDNDGKKQRKKNIGKK